MTTTCPSGQHAHHDVYAAQCPCRALLDLLANKWSALAIGALEEGPQRFGELQRKLQGVSPKVLTQTLRRLEDFGILDRTIYPAVPLHVEYALTPSARAPRSRSTRSAPGSRTTSTTPSPLSRPCGNRGRMRTPGVPPARPARRAGHSRDGWSSSSRDAAAPLPERHAGRPASRADTGLAHS
ncbi:winged helix-turn-helix transcriptional regulator [Streptomyces lasalocidi]